MPTSRWWARAVAPDRPLGRLLLSSRSCVQLAQWRPRDTRDLAVKRAIELVTPRYTMVAVPRLRQLVAHAETLHHEGIAGAVVECGTWRGGSLALIDWAFRALGDVRPLWGFDSFEGLPPPGAFDPAAAHRGFFQGWCAGSQDDVRR